MIMIPILERGLTILYHSVFFGTCPNYGMDQSSWMQRYGPLCSTWAASLDLLQNVTKFGPTINHYWILYLNGQGTCPVWINKPAAQSWSRAIRIPKV